MTLRGLAAAFSINISALRTPSSLSHFPFNSLFLPLTFSSTPPPRSQEAKEISPRSPNRWERGRRGSENRAKHKFTRCFSLRCVCARRMGVGIHRQTSGDVMVPAGYKPMLKKQCRSAAELNQCYGWFMDCAHPISALIKQEQWEWSERSTS